MNPVPAGRETIARHLAIPLQNAGKSLSFGRGGKEKRKLAGLEKSRMKPRKSAGFSASRCLPSRKRGQRIIGKRGKGQKKERPLPTGRKNVKTDERAGFSGLADAFRKNPGKKARQTSGRPV